MKISTRLRNILAYLYEDEASSRRVATDAGLNLPHLKFSDVSINTWQSIVSQAIKSEKVDTLFEVALKDFKDNQELLEVYKDYCKFGIGPDDPPDTGNELTQKPLSFFLIALLLEGIIAIGCYNLYLYTVKVKALGSPLLWLSIFIPLIIGIGIGLMATVAKNSKNYVFTGLSAGLLNSIGVAISLNFHLRGSNSVVDWEKVFYLYFIPPIFCIIVGGIIGSWLTQHIRVGEHV